MGYHPRIETTNIATFATTRSRNSELWLINNKELERAILGYVAKYKKRYGVTLYAFAIEGSHIHDTALFPNANRAHYMRDLNSSVARAVPRYVDTFPGGRFWGRRYSAEFVPNPEDIEKQFFYTVLQPVKDGLVDKLSEYPGYNCFHDAVCGVTRKFKVINWGAYQDAKRWNPKARMKDFTENFELSYERLPGYENLSRDEYRNLMFRKLEEHRQEILKARGRPSVGREALLRKRPGSLAKNPKKSTRFDRRPRVLCKELSTWKTFMKWYFSVYFKFKEASILYRSGVFDAPFPPGTYRPPSFTVLCTVQREELH